MENNEKYSFYEDKLAELASKIFTELDFPTACRISYGKYFNFSYSLFLLYKRYRKKVF